MQESQWESQARLERRRELARARRDQETAEQRHIRLLKRREHDRECHKQKRAEETSRDRQQRLKANRLQNAARRDNETTQERTRRLQAQRESARRRREQRYVVVQQRRNQRDEYLHNRGWVLNPSLHEQEWAQEELAAFHSFEENLRHLRCKVCKETWPLSNEHTAEENYSCIRCKRDKKSVRLYSNENDMDPGTVPAELQGLTEVEEMLIARAFTIMCVYRTHGGQRCYKGHVLNLPQDVQGFLSSLPANVSDLPILIIRKQGAGKSLKKTHSPFGLHIIQIKGFTVQNILFAVQ